MTPAELQATLAELMALPAETEWVEFKEAKNNYDSDDLGRYFSALSNEANLKGRACGWLVFGVSNKPPRQIVGSNYRLQPPGLDRLKSEVAQHTNHQITFQEIYETGTPQGRVVLFQIPSAPRGIPTEWKGRVYGRHDQSTSPLTLQEIEQIRNQAPRYDWSVETCEGADLDDLDRNAIAFARQEYHYKKMVVAYLTKFGEAKREDIDKLLIDKLSDALDDQQKRNFITNLLQEMRKDGVLEREGSNRWTKWHLHKSASESED